METGNYGLNWDNVNKNGIIFNDKHPQGALFKGEERKPDLGFEYISFMYSKRFKQSYVEVKGGKRTLTKLEIKKIVEVAKTWEQLPDEEGGLNKKEPIVKIQKPDTLPAAFISEEKTYGNLWVKEVALNKGEQKEGHRHEFDHLHFLVSGKAEFTINHPDGSKEVFMRTAPAWLKVPKELSHSIKALEDGTLGYCIQAIRNKDGEVVGTDYSAEYVDFNIGKDL